MSDEILVKNLSSMAKSIKQLEIDIKNVQNQKGEADPDDRFVEVMSGFVETVSENTLLCCLILNPF